jgi:nicotinamidase-related amidase
VRVNDRYLSFYYETDKDIGKIDMEIKKTALLVVDMQHFFVTRPAPGTVSDAEARRWAPFFDRIEQTVVPNNQKLISFFRQKKIDIVFARITTYTKEGRERSWDHKSSGFNNLLLVPGDPRGEIIPALAPREGEIVVHKTTDSALTGTNLRLALSNMGIDTVVVTGVLTDQCVSCTVRSLADESFKVWLIEDATMASTMRLHENELEILNNIYCHVINTEECIASLS